MPRAGLVSLAYRDLVREVRKGPLTAGELADIVGVKERQVHNWSSGTNNPKGKAKDRLLEVSYIVRLLSEIYLPEGVEIWLHGRNQSLGGQRPVDLLGEGDFRTFLAALVRQKPGSTGVDRNLAQ